MKVQVRFLSLALLTSTSVFAGNPAEINAFFERPVSCPLRLSSLSTLRDQAQQLASSLGPECAKNNAGAISNLNTTVANLEGITSTFNTYGQGTDSTAAQNQYAKNVNQLLGSLNTITSNTECVYDIKNRGLLPVASDVIMSASQLGLLVPSAPGMAIAAGGYVVGSALKIVNELIKDKYNFNKADDRKAFIQLNCAFFDTRKSMEESGIFDLATEDYRQEFATKLRKERAELLKEQRRRKGIVGQLETSVSVTLKSLPEAEEKNLDPSLLKKLDGLATALGSKPGDYASKWKQVQALAKEARSLSEGLSKLVLEGEADSLAILRGNLEKAIPLLAEGEKAWTANIDEWEIMFRGPLMAFIVPVANGMRSEISRLEDEIALTDAKSALSISRAKHEVKQINESNWILSQRITSLETKIAKLETSQGRLFSDTDEGTSNEVEILEYYRALQRSILGKEGAEYLRHAVRRSYDMEDAVEKQLILFNTARPGAEVCSAAEKLRFAWTQYRLKVQEAHDFVSTNLDLYRSSFRVGKEKVKRHQTYVLEQMDSVAARQRNEIPEEDSVGELMNNVTNKLGDVEKKLHESGCF